MESRAIVAIVKRLGLRDEALSKCSYICLSTEGWHWRRKFSCWDWNQGWNQDLLITSLALYHGPWHTNNLHCVLCIETGHVEFDQLPRSLESLAEKEKSVVVFHFECNCKLSVCSSFCLCAFFYLFFFGSVFIDLLTFSTEDTANKSGKLPAHWGNWFARFSLMLVKVFFFFYFIFEDFLFVLKIIFFGGGGVYIYFLHWSIELPWQKVFFEYIYWPCVCYSWPGSPNGPINTGWCLLRKHLFMFIKPSSYLSTDPLFRGSHLHHEADHF